jgi:hypothetical protein
MFDGVLQQHCFQAWKRVILAEGPRQSINALTLWAIILSKSKSGGWYDIPKYFPNGQKLAVSALTVTTFFTVLVFIGSMLLLIVAAVIYIPLLCYIQGNLKVLYPLPWNIHFAYFFLGVRLPQSRQGTSCQNMSQIIPDLRLAYQPNYQASQQGAP